MKLLTRYALLLSMFAAITCTTAFAAESAREEAQSPPAAVEGGGIVIRTAGASLAEELPKPADGGMMIVFADAHSPKNQFLIEGIQTALGKDFPIVGGPADTESKTGALCSGCGWHVMFALLGSR